MAEEMTLEQQKALAIASARMRAQQQAQTQAANPAMPQGKVNWGVELEKQAIDEMGMPERIFRSLGAGFADIPLGIKQRFASDKPEKLSDLVTGDTDFKRLQRQAADKREVDKYLSKKTDLGILPDQLPIIGDTPTLGSTAQAQGKIIPTMLLPAARLATLPGFLGNVATGAALSAIDPTVEGESAAGNAVVGGALSSVLPMASMIYRGGKNMITREGGQTRAADELAKNITPQGQEQTTVLRQTIDRLRNAMQPNATQNIPLSTAAQLRDAEIARLEAGSRARNGANWYDFDQNQARSVADAVRQATNSADDVGARRALRQSNIDTRKTQAFASVNEGAFNADINSLRANLEAAMRSPDASNPAVRNMLNAIREEMDRLGPDFTPQHLATIRANLSGKTPLMPQNAYQAAPRDSVATMSVLQNVDNILNNATNRRWQDVVSGYARDSDAVRAAQAAGKVREAYWDNTGRVRKTAADVAGDVPLITQFNLGSAIDSTRGPTKNVLLSNEANMRLNAVLDALRQQDIVKGVKRTATAGGGSNTASDMFAAKSAGAVADAVTNAAGGPAASVGKGMIDSLRDYANRNKDRALAEALQNPQQMISLLEAKIASKAPITAQEQYLYSMLRGAPAAAATN